MQNPVDRSDRRVRWTIRIVFIWGLLILARLVQLQVIEHKKYAQLALKQQIQTVSVPPDRGEVRDRTGYAMAVSLRTESAAINPQLVGDPELFAGMVAPILSLNTNELAERIRAAKAEKASNGKAAGRSFLMLARHITPEQKDRLNALQRRTFPFIEILPDWQREYPAGMTGSHVVGSIDAEGQGNSGVEQRLNVDLKGAPGKERVLTDSQQAHYYTQEIDRGRQGVNLTLTIHRLIQDEAEKQLAEAVTKSGAWSGSVVVLDPTNGEVFALANYPTFDPRNTEPSEEEVHNRKNIAVQEPCEPGSVMKMITVTMGIDSGKFTPETPIFCENGVFPRPGRRPIHDVHHYGMLDAAGVLIKSSNIGVTKISLAHGPEMLYSYLKRFGMGDSTHIGLPGESRGMLRPLDKWDPASHEYISFGHEIAATAVQLARAVGVIANGGLLVHPHVVMKKELLSRDGESGTSLPVEVEPPKRVLRPETAFQIRLIMQRVVLEGTGRQAAIPGYSSGGKTGSAELYDFKAKAWINRHNSSFIGFAPVQNPRVVVVVTLNGSRQLGGISAAPVFREVTHTALRVLKVPKDMPETESKPKVDPHAKPDAELIAEAAPERELALAVPEDQVLPPGVLVSPTAPDFLGKSVVNVVRESAKLGLPIEIVGRGIARSQVPPAGAPLAAGKPIVVKCSWK
jgi:cell division protein FtsI (penicillin-binding protein 3)